MDFNSLRKEIKSKNASVKELVNEFFLKIDSKDSLRFCNVILTFKIRFLYLEIYYINSKLKILFLKDSFTNTIRCIDSR